MYNPKRKELIKSWSCLPINANEDRVRESPVNQNLSSARLIQERWDQNFLNPKLQQRNQRITFRKIKSRGNGNEMTFQRLILRNTRVYGIDPKDLKDERGLD